MGVLATGGDTHLERSSGSEGQRLRDALSVRGDLEHLHGRDGNRVFIEDRREPVPLRGRLGCVQCQGGHLQGDRGSRESLAVTRVAVLNPVHRLRGETRYSFCGPVPVTDTELHSCGSDSDRGRSYVYPHIGGGFHSAWSGVGGPIGSIAGLGGSKADVERLFRLQEEASVRGCVSVVGELVTLHRGHSGLVWRVHYSESEAYLRCVRCCEFWFRFDFGPDGHFHLVTGERAVGGSQTELDRVIRVGGRHSDFIDPCVCPCSVVQESHLESGTRHDGVRAHGI